MLWKNFMDTKKTRNKHKHSLTKAFQSIINYPNYIIKCQFSIFYHRTDFYVICLLWQTILVLLSLKTRKKGVLKVNYLFTINSFLQTWNLQTVKLAKVLIKFICKTNKLQICTKTWEKWGGLRKKEFSHFWQGTFGLLEILILRQHSSLIFLQIFSSSITVTM